MHEPKTKHELRCFCSRRPLLAMYGLDTKGNLYVHVRIYKANRIFGEMLVSSGTVHLRCRECFRWQRVHIVSPGVAELKTEPRPEALIVESGAAGSLPRPEPRS